MTQPISLDALRGSAQTLATALGAGDLIWHRWGQANAAPPLVLLHGGFGSWTHWAANIEQLCLERELWVPDLPGLGDSAALPPPQSLEAYAMALAGSFDQLAGSRQNFDIAGFSFGALIGAQWAAQVGSRCGHLVVCGAAGFGDLHVQVDLQRPPGPDVPAQQAEAIHRSNLAALMLYQPETIDDLAVHIHADNLARSRFNSRRLARSSGFIEALPAIEASLCGIWGVEDATAGGRDNILARKSMFWTQQPGCGFHILEEVGHWTMYEAPQAYNALLLEALRH